ncbi:MAG TPA: hypothetical protein VMR25_07055, partial [Planctomycetaceae bacterium]|nr:hypothetical protein [Planctomycetaceae bacterium]
MADLKTADSNVAKRKAFWKPRSENTILGTRVPRIDGVEKASGFAKYSADVNPPGTLYVRLLTSKPAHAKIKLIDVKAAEKMPGVKVVHLLKEVGAEVHWDGDMIAAVAAERIEQAEDGVRAIKIEYEPLPTYVDDRDVVAAEKAGRAKTLRDRVSKDFDAVLKSAAAV